MSARARRRRLKEAAALALAGQPEPALVAFSELAEQGSLVATASAAELRAFSGDWLGALQAAGAFLRSDGGDVYAGNVRNDMVRLAGRAGHHLESWDAVGQQARLALAAVDGHGWSEHRTAAGRAHLEALAAYAERQGAPPHELIRLFGGPARSELSYEEVMARQPELRPDLAPGSPEHVAFRWAQAAPRERDDVLTALVADHPGAVDFAMVVPLARHHVSAGRGDLAWELVAPRIASWIPVDAAQVAPVVLVVDPVLGPWMTPARCRQVLETARG